MIAKPLQRLAVPVGDLTIHPRNDHHQGDVGAISQSLERFGQLRPILVQKSTSYVVAGNHVLLAARALGWPKIAAAVVEMSDDDALAYLVADNRLPQLGTFDDRGVADLLGDLTRDGGLEGTGYDAEDYGRLLADLADPTDAEWSSAVGALRSGEPDFTQISFVLHVTDAETVREAIARALADGAVAGRTRSEAGAAIAHVCAAYIGGHE